MRRSTVLAKVAVVAAVVVSLAAPAQARSEKTLAYPREQVWPTAVRFLRVDERLKIIEKDADAGYVLFELKEENHTFRGSLEVIAVQQDGRTQVRFVIQIEDRPSYLENEMLERLQRKLHLELGSPAPPPSKREPPADHDRDRDRPRDSDRERDKDKPISSGGARDKDPPKDPPPSGLRELPHDELSPTP